MTPSLFLRRRFLAPLAALALTNAGHAQVLSDDTDWKESDVPAAPAFTTDKLLPLDMPLHVSVRFGIDPNTIAVTPDGVVRYVVVAINASGSVTAMYEGIRCAKGEVKLYARTNGTNPWTVVKDAQWRSLYDGQPSRHSVMFARQGACDNGAPAAFTADGIIRAMKKTLIR